MRTSALLVLLPAVAFALPLRDPTATFTMTLTDVMPVYTSSPGLPAHPSVAQARSECMRQKGNRFAGTPAVLKAIADFCSGKTEVIPALDLNGDGVDDERETLAPTPATGDLVERGESVVPSPVNSWRLPQQPGVTSHVGIEAHNPKFVKWENEQGEKSGKVWRQMFGLEPVDPPAAHKRDDSVVPAPTPAPVLPPSSIRLPAAALSAVKEQLSAFEATATAPYVTELIVDGKALASAVPNLDPKLAKALVKEAWKEAHPKLQTMDAADIKELATAAVALATNLPHADLSPQEDMDLGT